MPVILAHGALGPFDEIIFLGIALVFLVMMGLSWARSQQLPADEIEPDEGDDAVDKEHFKLE